MRPEIRLQQGTHAGDAALQSAAQGFSATPSALRQCYSRLKADFSYTLQAADPGGRTSCGEFCTLRWAARPVAPCRFHSTPPILSMGGVVAFRLLLAYAAADDALLSDRQRRLWLGEFGMR